MKKSNELELNKASFPFNPPDFKPSNFNSPNSNSPDTNLPGKESDNLPASGNAVALFNRELSWIEFNERVLGEGLRKDLPPLERLKYLSIVSSNLDEFFMVRVAAIKRIRESGSGADPSGFNPNELLEKITGKVRSLLGRQFDALTHEVFPDCTLGGLTQLRPGEWSDSQRSYLESFFNREIYPILTPLRLNDEDPLPSIDNYSMYAAFLLEDERSKEECFSMIRIPHIPERIIWLPRNEIVQNYWAMMEDLVVTWAASLYPGYRIIENLVFKVNRDADFSVDERRDEDFIEAMAEVIEGRDSSMPVRLVYNPGSKKIRDCLARRLSLKDDDLFEVEGPINLKEIYEPLVAKGFDSLNEKPWKVYSHPAFSLPAFPGDESLWDRISQGDVLLHVPYQSFDPVIRLFQEAASDPAVAAIKTTLYRTSGDSPIVKALEQASLSGKHVTAVVELKARFDEERNISWANRLEKAGVIVVYGLARLKIHAKVTLVMRREYDKIKRYTHLSTGNYNDRTARVYEDMSLFTAREDIAYDAGLLFNVITGYSAGQSMAKLVMAPTSLKRRLLDLIAREMNRSSPESPGRIMAKMNALADPEIIRALYRASRAGVKVQLCVRGICQLIPGVKDLSENITVVSIIDHFLEHSRIYYFANGGAEELYLASADWMTRNLERRVELMFPVLQDDVKKTIFENLSAYFRDNCQAWLLNSKGVWTRIEPPPGEKPFRIQAYIHSQAAKAQSDEHPGPARGEFIVRRSSPNGNPQPPP